MSNQAPANIEAAYQEVEGTIKGLAIKYAQKKGIAFEEAISVCHEGFMQAWRKFNPEAGAKFNSWVHTQIKFECRNHDKKELRHRQRFGSLVGDEVLHAVEGVMSSNGALVQEVASRVESKDAKTAIQFALTNERLKKRQVRKHFRENEGWSDSRAAQVWREVRHAFIVD